MILGLALGVPFLLALALPVLRIRAHVIGGLTALVMAFLFVLALLQLPAITQVGAMTVSIPWIPQLGLTLSLYIDGLALLFVLLITGIGAAVMLYAGYYFEDGRQAARFLSLLLAFTGSMLALVLAGNVLTLFIAWELTSITSFLLIGFYGKSEAARRGASQALMITGGGGLALLVGLLLMGSASVSLELADLLANGELLRAHPWYTAFVILILIGCFSKSAQFPLHFWLPGAMSAPTPASAFLHSATMVKAGIYLLARLSPILGDTPLWTMALPAVGLATLLIGAVLALRQRDLKGMLAYSTISQLGALVALIGLPNGDGLKAAYVGILAHGLYKCALFLVVGAVDHATGTRDIAQLGGLRRQLPGFAIVTAIAGLSMAGVPPLFGFVSKELLIEAAEVETLALVIVVLSAAFTVTLALRLFWEVFMRAPPTHADSLHFHELPRPLVAGPGLLAGASIVAGIGISPLVTPLVEPAVGKPISLYLFPPYITLAFLLSMTALAAGIVVFLTRRWWLAWPVPATPGGSQIYGGLVSSIERTADLLLRSQGGKIRYYLVAILTAVVVLLATAIVPLVPFEAPPIEFSTAADVLKAVLLVLALVATGASILFGRHLLAALSLGVAGYAIGGIFLLEPAPDVALVQFLVETLATVLIILILARTSPEERQRAMANVWGQTRRGLLRDLSVSVALGSAMTIFALAAVNSRPTPNTIARWHLENALPQVGVSDVVASIVTDFRGTDTLMEITVFGMASLGVLTLLARPTPGKIVRLIRRRNPTDTAYAPVIEEPEDRPIVYQWRFTNPVTYLAARLVLPFSFMIAVAHIAYAGVAPGDGFTAGVMIGLGIALWFVVFGYQETRARLRWLHPAPLIGAGMTLALANAVLPLLFGREFFAFTQVSGVSVADIKIASTLVFEIGICLTVFGGISTIMEAISHPQECEPL
jgi:NADH:ubiquinone oxidoreductase subunit 5 (subunit L)/multisubunit Na+/H+ antiporter MnhA subunit/multisubunit Na+/H+ antiporter MnhB subunit